MPVSLWKLTVCDDFCAAHALRHYQGKCENLHGHNYAVELSVQGSQLIEKKEFLFDFGDLKALLKEAISPFDHAHLNAIQPFDAINPSAENIARYIWQRVAPKLPQHVRMHSVTVAEKDKQSACYMEIEHP